ncbi:hypothetical protein [Paenibacillus bovis]|uniref:DUF4145 domain-containing protein n=1 Tax=Paenibacillus bovis TaxID=1616788 RepID=A0A172ZKS4_9BACL|nr:hypothetical protein [Paenibacillus bovis]ANF97857.1 hypothetical protein AR543_18780 [Paenibacillus bovis]
MDRREELMIRAKKLDERYGDQLEVIANKFEEQYEKFMLETEGENYFQIILRSHLYIEFEMAEILNSKLTHPQELGDKLAFNVALKILLAIGAIPLDLKAPINFLNRIRNKYAHELDFQFDEETFEKFVDTFAIGFDRSVDIYRNGLNDYSLLKSLKQVLFSLWVALIGYRLISEDIATELNNL